jgi:hypothetical protein
MRRKRHNKKRNSAFLYEVVVREMARSIIGNNLEKKQYIAYLIREYFNSNTELSKELELYKTLNETQNLSPYVAEKLIQETKHEYKKINKQKLFIEQSKIISKINKNLSKNVFSNFVPNYKSLATISQIFNDETSVKNRVLLEAALLNKITNNYEENSGKQIPVTNLVYRTFIKKFNEKYNNSLLEEQKTLLHNYIMSFDDNGIQLKLFLNEELSRLKKIINESLTLEEVVSDSEMVNKTKKVLNLMEDFKNKPIDSEALIQILKIQNLVQEVQENA